MWQISYPPPKMAFLGKNGQNRDNQNNSGTQTCKLKLQGKNASVADARTQRIWLIKGWVSYSYSYGPNHLKSSCFCANFKWLRLGFQNSDPIQHLVICKPTSFQPFKIWTCTDLRSPLYSRHSVIRHVQ